MRRNKLFLGAALAVCGLSLASCGAKEARNTVTPLGSLEAKKGNVVATAANNKYELKLEQFYNKLRYNGFGKVNTAIESKVYSKEIAAITELYTKKGKAISGDSKNVLAITNKDNKALYELTDAKLEELYNDLMEEINTVIGTKIFGTADVKQIKVKEKNEKEYNKSIQSFIDAQAKLGVTITKDDLKYTIKDDADIISFPEGTLTKLNDAVNAVILEQAKLLSSMNALYKIASEEFIKQENEDGKEVDVKNPNYILKDTAYENAYNSGIKTYGTYNAIVIQFNSRRDAEILIEELKAAGKFDLSTPEKALETYVELYKEHYNYRINTTDEINPNNYDDFKYVISEDDNDFTKLPSTVADFIKDTMEDDTYLSEPRNLNNKYVLAYKMDTKYDNADSKGEALEYKDLSAAKKTEVNQKITENLIKENAKNYQATDYEKKLESKELKIYDPFFEYKFEYANPEIYDHITEKTTADSNIIFSYGEEHYTVEKFFEEATKEYATPILSDFFQLEFANQYYDQFVEKDIISKSAKDDNKKALDEAIKGFNSGKNSTYPKEIGLDTFLLASYGYSNEDDVLKYYYDSKAALDAYKAMKVFDDWADIQLKDFDYSKLSKEDKDKYSILQNLLDTGNELLSQNKLFSINIDHFLINIDENGDGTPDDPAEFLADLTDEQEANFQNAVTELARAIIKEASYEKYKDNTLFETLTFIKSQYEEGKPLLSDPAKTWDDYKEYNFLITVEQLASSGDITQDSVNNFVPEFKAYVEQVYNAVSKEKLELDEDDEKGKFYVVDTTTESHEGKVINFENASEVEYKNLCATSFGYHVLVVNSYEGPDDTKYTESDDVSEFQKNIQVVLRKHEANKDDKNDKEYTISVNTDSYNSNADKVSMNQLFIYYVQQANGVDSVLDSDIKKLMGSLFDGAITTYTSSNFQTYLLLKDLNIQIKSDSGIHSTAISAEMSNLKDIITSYDSQSPYQSWFDKTWVRPAK